MKSLNKAVLATVLMGLAGLANANPMTPNYVDVGIKPALPITSIDTMKVGVGHIISADAPLSGVVTAAEAHFLKAGGDGAVYGNVMVGHTVFNDDGLVFAKAGWGNAGATFGVAAIVVPAGSSTGVRFDIDRFQRLSGQQKTIGTVSVFRSF